MKKSDKKRQYFNNLLEVSKNFVIFAMYNQLLTIQNKFIMKKIVLLLLLLLTMQLAASATNWRGFCYISVEGGGIYPAEYTVWNHGTGHNVSIWCPDLSIYCFTCYAIYLQDEYAVVTKLIEICEEHNIYYPNDPVIHYYATVSFEELS